MIVFQPCGKYLVSLYAASTTAVINIYQINREHVQLKHDSILNLFAEEHGILKYR